MSDTAAVYLREAERYFDGADMVPVLPSDPDERALASIWLRARVRVLNEWLLAGREET